MKQRREKELPSQTRGSRQASLRGLHLSRDLEIVNHVHLREEAANGRVSELEQRELEEGIKT